MAIAKCVPLWCGALGLLPVVAGCATTDATGGGEKISKAIAVPANYRRVVASYFRANVKHGKMLKAEISRPGVWSRPSWVGGPQPIVCIKWRARGPVIDQNHTLAFMFENGKVADIFDPEYINLGAGGALGAAIKNAATCGKLKYVSFPEIMRSR